MGVIGEGINLWLRFLKIAIILLVPSYLAFSLWVGGDVMTATGNETAGEIIKIIGGIISKVTTMVGNFLIAIIIKPLAIFLCIFFVIYIKFFK